MGATPRSTRREFLQGKAAADALGEIGSDSVFPQALPQRAPDHYLLKFARRAMACQFEIFFNAGQYPQDSEAALAALDLVDQLEDQLSVYRQTSDISRVNRLASDEAVELEPQLWALLEKAIQLHAETAGAYDITSGSLSNVWGFTRRAGAIPTEEVLTAARQQVGSQFLHLDRAASSVRFTKRDLEINLGSIGKGYALDRCAELLTAAGIQDFLLHGGNSSVLGRGASSALERDAGWLVGLRNPLRPDRRIGQLRLCNRALATSGSGTQYFLHEGKRYGHILDPRSGWPAEGVLSASVLAQTAAEADALSTAFYVMGPQAAREFCDSHPDVSAVIFCPGAREGAIEKHLLALNDQDWIDLNEV